MTAAREANAAVLSVRLGGMTVGLLASDVREVVRAVAITPLPGAPPIIEGVVNVRGAIVPVVDMRRRFGLATRAPDADEFLVMLDAGGRAIAMRVDDVDDLVAVGAAEIRAPGELSPALRSLAGLAALPDGTLVICDPAAFVSQAEGDAIDAALDAA